MRLQARTIGIVLLIMVGLIMVSISYAEPSSPTSITRGASERSNISNPMVVQAQAGNVTALTITATRATRRWQGFYGNITGEIVLDDANNNSMYNWDITDPEGEIYASNGSDVSWDDVQCINFSTNTSVLKYNVSQLNEFVGLTSEDEQAEPDSVNGTFNQTFGDDGNTFSIGDTIITNQDNCSMVTLNVDDAYQTSDFQEVLLTDNQSIIFASIIEQSATGFQGAPVDFQIIVGVNGTTEGVTRDYYFFVELS